jgi:pyridoxamine 5'-phosphate oxidase
MNESRSQPVESILEAIGKALASRDIPDPPPVDPMPLFKSWYDDARESKRYDDFDAMTLATATRDGMPSARMVLCRVITLDPPSVMFFTNYNSRKGRELIDNPHAAAVFHWPHATRQVRLEGDIERATDAESDAYFNSRPLISRVGSSVSQQSQPLASRAEMIAAATRAAAGAAIGRLERPQHWGGFRLHIRRIELWCSGNGRMHDRFVWTRTSSAGPATWAVQRLWP